MTPSRQQASRINSLRQQASRNARLKQSSFNTQQHILPNSPYRKTLALKYESLKKERMIAESTNIEKRIDDELMNANRMFFDVGKVYNYKTMKLIAPELILEQLILRNKFINPIYKNAIFKELVGIVRQSSKFRKQIISLAKQQKKLPNDLLNQIAQDISMKIDQTIYAELKIDVPMFKSVVTETIQEHTGQEV
ncbi:MAG: hypothetical protein PHQ98_01525 [Candidatus ainarchaeum sp.]|nr:hypothetical protein [Candidatus ainarchaeum sp.]